MCGVGEAVKALANELYDVETRPAKVVDALTKVGFVAALSKVGVVNGEADKGCWRRSLRPGVDTGCCGRGGDAGTACGVAAF